MSDSIDPTTALVDTTATDDCVITIDEIGAVPATVANTAVVVKDDRADDTTDNDYIVIEITENDPWEDTPGKLPQVPSDALKEWIDIHEANGITQHSAEWLEAKRFVIGGSKIAMVEGTCPYSAVASYVREKSMGINLPMGIAAQWGNLMEEIIKQQVERDYDTVVLGENLFVRDPNYKGVAYSPDGLAVMNVGARGSMPNRGGSICNLLMDAPNPTEKSPRVVLVEFKCPWSRTPDGTPPANYVPQVKMGLDMIRVASIGLLVEAVYRRCTVAQLSTLEFNDLHTQKTAHAPKSPAQHIASGIIGVMIREHPVVSRGLYDDWPQWYMDIQKWRKENGADFGRMPTDVFTTLMAAIDRHDLGTWYPRSTMSAGEAAREFAGCCAGSGCISLGVIPWKLIRIDYHWIAPEYGYLEKVGPRIDLINTTVIDAIDNPRNAHNIISDFDVEWEALTGAAATSRGKPLHKPAVEKLDAQHLDTEQLDVAKELANATTDTPATPTDGFKTRGGTRTRGRSTKGQSTRGQSSRGKK